MDNNSPHSHQQAEGHHIAQASDGGTAAVYTVDKVFTRSDSEELNSHLARAVSAYEARMYQLVARPATALDQPYKFLYAFEAEDADTFFGRDMASEAFHRTVLKDRLTVLHGKSGAGKTSLLNAGLSPALIRERRLPAYARAYEDPVLAIKQAIVPSSLGPWPEALHQLTLHEFLGLTCANLSRKTQELVIILDQFEEFFIFWPEQDHRRALMNALGDCCDDKALPIRLVIALRKDYYSDLATFQCRFPRIFHNEYYLDAMTRKEAEAAITGPVGKLSCTVTYEPVLLYALLDDLARGGMELPHLQIICTRLYESLPENGTVITLASYEKLGRVEGVLGRYLHDVLDRLPGKLESIARDVLKELVSSEATRRVLRYDVLVARIEAEQDKLDSVLGSLVDARLLRRKEEAGEVAYEMAHEYLIEEVKVWIDQADLTFKQAEELLMREVANWRVHGTLIPVDRLALLYGQRERFKGLDDETQECLLRSAVYTCVDFTDWADLTAGEAGERVLLAALQDPNIWTRRTATLYLGSIWGMPEVSLLASGSGNERCRAAEALGKLGDNRAVEPLIAALRDCDYDEDSYLPTVAAEALRDLADSRTAEPLIAALQIQDGSVRLFAVNLLGAILDPRAIEPLLVALEDEYGDVRDAAALVLGNLREPRAVEPLVALLRRKYSYMAEEALGALLSIGTMEALTAILEREAYHVDDYYFYEAAEAVGQLGDRRAVKPLIIALRDQDVNIREAAVEALVELGEPAVPQLTAALRDERRNVHQAASKALEKIGTQEALAALGASHDPEQKE